MAAARRLEQPGAQLTRTRAVPRAFQRLGGVLALDAMLLAPPMQAGALRDEPGPNFQEVTHVCFSLSTLDT